MHRKRVLLPAPLGPMSATTSPELTDIETLLRTTWSPNCFSTFCSTMASCGRAGEVVMTLAFR